MPRPTKAYRRQKVNAAKEWAKGNKAEARKLWKTASDALRTKRTAKRTRHAPKPAAPAEGASA